jgi:allophanate hydrolase
MNANGRGAPRPGTDLGLARVHAAYASGASDPQQLLAAVVDAARAACSDGTLVSVADPGDVMAQAGAVGDQLARRGPDAFADLPLLGVPIVVKDNIDVAGLATTAGCAAYAYHPDTTAPAVQRLVDAGAVVVGKSSLDQFATGLVGVRTEHPPPLNALDPHLVPGGSSAGSAVAVARSLVTFGVGTDTAGSGRVPAAMNGIVSYKPAPGRVPTSGVVPASWSLDCLNVFGADVDATVAASAVMDATHRWRSLRPGCVGVVNDDGLGDCQPGTASALAAVADGLGSVAEVATVDIAALFAVGDLLYSGPWLAERTAALGAFIEAHPNEVHPVVADVVLSGKRWSATDVYAAQRTLRQLAAGPVADLWRRIDVLVVPTVGWMPTVHEVLADPIATNMRLGRFTHFANLLGLESVTVPVRWVVAPHPAVPFSVTVLSPTGRAAMAVHVARHLGAAAADFGPAPEPVPTPGCVEVVVAGAHLSGFELEQQLLACGGHLLRRAHTSPSYRLHLLSGGPVARPALERVAAHGSAIAVEVWSVPIETLGVLVTEVLPPLAMGSVELDDGSRPVGFVCELGGLAGATEITASHGWRQWRNHVDPTAALS